MKDILTSFFPQWCEWSSACDDGGEMCSEERLQNVDFCVEQKARSQHLYYLTRAVSSLTSDLGKEVLAAVCRVACVVWRVSCC